MGYTNTTLRAYLLERASKGYANSEIACEGFTPRQVLAISSRMKDSGLLFVGKRSWKDARYFDTQAKATAYENGKAYKARNMRQIVISKPRVCAWWPADAKPHITAQTKYTYGASPGRVLRTNTFSE